MFLRIIPVALAVALCAGASPVPPLRAEDPYQEERRLIDVYSDRRSACDANFASLTLSIAEGAVRLGPERGLVEVRHAIGDAEIIFTLGQAGCRVSGIVSSNGVSHMERVLASARSPIMQPAPAVERELRYANASAGCSRLEISFTLSRGSFVLAFVEPMSEALKQVENREPSVVTPARIFFAIGSQDCRVAFLVRPAD